MKNIKIVPLILLTLLTVISSGCSSGPQWAFRHNGTEISAGMYNYYLMQAIVALEQKETEAHEDDPDYVLPQPKDLLKLATDGMSNSNWVKKEAAALCAAYFLVNDLFDKNGLVIDDAERSSVGMYADYIMSYDLDFYDDNGIGRNSVYEYYLSDVKKDLVFLNMYTEGGERAVSDEDLKNIFLEKYAKVEVMAIARDDEDGGDSKAKAEAYFKRYEAGEKIEDLIYDYDSEIAGEDATADKPEEGSAISFLDIGNATTDASRAMVTGEIGKPQLVEDTSYYYICTRFDVLGDPADFDEYREALLYSEKLDEFDEYLREGAAGITLEVNESVIRSYTPEKLKIS